MKYAVLILALLLALPAQAQEVSPPRSPKKAFALSLLLPGLGHRYAHGGSWRGAASGLALAEAGFWTGTFVSDWRHGATVESFETLAATRAGADIEGKDREFFLNLATFISSEEFRATKLRNRAWDEIDYVSDPAFQWQWASEEDFERFRDLRDEADTFRNRRTLFIAAMAANRLVAAFTAIRATNRANRAMPDLSLSFAPPPDYAETPVVHLRVQF